jgi:hypothetical protein
VALILRKSGRPLMAFAGMRRAISRHLIGDYDSEIYEQRNEVARDAIKGGGALHGLPSVAD